MQDRANPPGRDSSLEVREAAKVLTMCGREFKGMMELESKGEFIREGITLYRQKRDLLSEAENERDPKCSRNSVYICIPFLRWVCSVKGMGK